jgi:hypothetical protein
MSRRRCTATAMATGKYIHSAGGLQPAVDASGAAEQQGLCAHERWCEAGLKQTGTTLPVSMGSTQRR